MDNQPHITLLTSPDWRTYELLDSGDGKKLERYGPYIVTRPENQALWKPALPAEAWKKAQAVFHPAGGESGGAWEFTRPMPKSWEMEYKGFKFQAQTSGSRHMGVFPEQANHWDWIEHQAEGVEATMDIPTQDTADLPMHDVKIELPRVHFEVLEGEDLAVMDGELGADGKIAGKFTQSGVEGTFELVRQTAGSAAVTRAPPPTPTPYAIAGGQVEEITFNSGPFGIVGDLWLPEGGRPVSGCPVRTRRWAD